MDTHRLGHTVLVGEAGKIRAMVVRKTKTDRRDARHLLDLLKHDRFPAVWIPDPGTRDLRALVAQRAKLWSQRGLGQLQALSLPPHTRRRRDDSLELLTWLTSRIDQLDEQIA